jgi:hypothetical protein
MRGRCGQEGRGLECKGSGEKSCWMGFLALIDHPYLLRRQGEERKSIVKEQERERILDVAYCAFKGLNEAKVTKPQIWSSKLKQAFDSAPPEKFTGTEDKRGREPGCRTKKFWNVA